MDLCCDDYIYIYDDNHDLMDTLMSNSGRKTLLSSSNVVYVRMDLQSHWKCTGGIIQYKQGIRN